MLARDPGEEACRVEEDGVDDDEDDIGNAIAVEILWSKITSAWVHVNHDGGKVTGLVDWIPSLQC